MMNAILRNRMTGRFAKVAAVVVLLLFVVGIYVAIEAIRNDAATRPLSPTPEASIGQAGPAATQSIATLPAGTGPAANQSAANQPAVQPTEAPAGLPVAGVELPQSRLQLAPQGKQNQIRAVAGPMTDSQYQELAKRLAMFSGEDADYLVMFVAKGTNLDAWDGTGMADEHCLASVMVTWRGDKFEIGPVRGAPSRRPSRRLNRHPSRSRSPRAASAPGMIGAATKSRPNLRK